VIKYVIYWFFKRGKFYFYFFWGGWRRSPLRETPAGEGDLLFRLWDSFPI